MGVLSAVNSAKSKINKGISDVTGFLNEQKRQQIENLDPQWKNVFEIVVYNPNAFSGEGLMSNVADAAKSVGDYAFYSLYARTITFPFNAFEYERANEVQYVKNIVEPTECTMLFLEDDLGVVRRYFQAWFDSIAYYDYDEHIGKKYYFNPDQEGIKKNAKIILLSKTGLPNELILSVQGLRPKGMNELVLGHNEGEPLQVMITFVLDTCIWESPATKAALSLVS